MSEQALSSKLDTIIKLLVLGLTEGKRQKDQIRLLSQAGFRPAEIGTILETTSNTVRVALVGLRKNKRQRSVGENRNAKK